MLLKMVAGDVAYAIDSLSGVGCLIFGWSSARPESASTISGACTLVVIGNIIPRLR